MVSQLSYLAIGTLASKSFSSLDARGAGKNLLGVATSAYSDILNIRVETTTRLIFGMRNVVSETWGLATNFTRCSHLLLLGLTPRSGTPPDE